MIYWAPLLHFYQPPTQVHWVLDRICDESYRPLLRMFNDIPTAKVTININAVLTELLRDHGKSDIIKGLVDMAERGQAEFTGSGKYHPILPLIPQEEAARQVTQNWESNRSLLGQAYHPVGFFPPEMAYSQEIVPTVLASGYRWIILSGVACPSSWPVDTIHYIPEGQGGLNVFFRDDLLSNEISFKQTDEADFINHLRDIGYGKKDAYIITAMDAETFGHHIKNWEKIFLAEVYQAIAGIQAVTITELMDLFPRASPVQPHPSSWSTSGDDLRAGNPYPLWRDTGNEIQSFLWEHADIAIKMVKRAKELADNEGSHYYADIARTLIDRALHSDQFWWASRKPWWDINLVNRGLLQQFEAVFNAYKAIKTSDCSPQVKTELYYLEVASRDLRTKIMDRLLLP